MTLSDRAGVLDVGRVDAHTGSQHDSIRRRCGRGLSIQRWPGALRFQMAFRTHVLIDAGSVPSNTFTLLLGLAN